MGERPEPCWWARIPEGERIVFTCDEAQARIVDNAPEMLAWLRGLAVEHERECPWCYGSRRHFDDCAIGALIARIDGKAG